MKKEMETDSSVREIERAIVDWTGELLGEPVDAGDNFLDLGGHSVLALTLIDKIRATLGAEVGTQLLFEVSLAEVAVEVARQQRKTVRSDAP